MKYPELQKYLDETRSTLQERSPNDGELGAKSLKDYRDTLKTLIDKYEKKTS